MQNSIKFTREKNFDDSQYLWLSKFQPDDKLLNDQVYRLVKRMMDLFLLFLGFPFFFRWRYFAFY